MLHNRLQCQLYEGHKPSCSNERPARSAFHKWLVSQGSVLEPLLRWWHDHGKVWMVILRSLVWKTKNTNLGCRRGYREVGLSCISGCADGETEVVKDTNNHVKKKDQDCTGGLQSFCCKGFKGLTARRGYGKTRRGHKVQRGQNLSNHTQLLTTLSFMHMQRIY